jgi:hypothetical protein
MTFTELATCNIILVVVAERLVFLLRIQEAPDSNASLENGFPESDFLFSSAPPGTCLDNSLT